MVGSKCKEHAQGRGVVEHSSHVGSAEAGGFGFHVSAADEEQRTIGLSMAATSAEVGRSRWSRSSGRCADKWTQWSMKVTNALFISVTESALRQAEPTTQSAASSFFRGLSGRQRQVSTSFVSPSSDYLSFPSSHKADAAANTSAVDGSLKIRQLPRPTEILSHNVMSSFSVRQGRTRRTT